MKSRKSSSSSSSENNRQQQGRRIRKTMNTNNTNNSNSSSTMNIRTSLICVICCLFSFQLGVTIGPNNNNNCDCEQHQQESSSSKTTTTRRNKVEDLVSFFPKTMENLFYGSARVKRDDFMQSYEATLGIPFDRTSYGNEDVVLLYSDANAMPSSLNKDKSSSSRVLLSTKEATENCHVMKVVLTEANNNNHCMALVGQWESYHIWKYMRLPPDSEGRNGIDPKVPLRHVARTHNERFGKAQVIPRNYNVAIYEKLLLQYMNNLSNVLDTQLQPILHRIAGRDGYIGKHDKKKKKSTNNSTEEVYTIENTIIVLTCNYGQSELLLNFLCNCRSKGFDTSRILVFPTDKKTKELMDNFGIATFYDSVLFDNMSENPAKRYGDGLFKGMMMAKVFCVHMVLSLGYDVLFQDVDVVWFRHPLEFFAQQIPQDEARLNALGYGGSDGNVYDIYFQDDGSRTPRYAPFSANTGFYYVRYSERTLYFFTQLIRQGDTIIQSGSHQGALTAVMNEHVMYRGLRIRVYNARTTDYFPGGFHYHQSGNKTFMKQLFQRMNIQEQNNIKNNNNLVNPYLFHMSWTENHINKKKFFQQMGQWYVHDQCTTDITSTTTPQQCCLKEPQFICHYRDKPSKKSCPDSDPIDNGHPSWW